MSRLCLEQVRVKDGCILDVTTNRRRQKASMTVINMEPLNDDASRWTSAYYPRYLTLRHDMRPCLAYMRRHPAQRESTVREGGSEGGELTLSGLTVSHWRRQL